MSARDAARAAAQVGQRKPGRQGGQRKPGRQREAGRAPGRGPRRIVVIGGGIAGLATAALLARDGHDVELLEQRPATGGRAGSWAADGFRFDTGPSWYLMPEVFEHFFRLLGTSTADQLELTRLDPAYRVFFEHAEPVDVVTGRAPEIFESLEPGSAEQALDYLATARETYDTARPFLYSSFATLGSVLNARNLRLAPRLLRLLLEPLDRFVGRRFDDPRIRQVLGYPAVFLGTSPDRAPSMYHLMSHLDLTDGVFYPQGGFARLIEAVEGLARAHGVRVRTGATVTAIDTSPTANGGAGQGPRSADPTRPARRLARVRSALRTALRGSPRAHVTGVTFRDGAGKHRLDADVVVGAADLHHVETQLLPRELQTYPERWWRRRESGPGAVLVYLGVRGQVDLPHHALFFTQDWDRNFGDIRGGRVPEPASAYVCRPSVSDPDVAPPGDTNLFILIPVPADPEIGRGGEGGAGDPLVERIADAAIDQVASWAQVPNLRERIAVRRTVGPGDFAADLNAWQGGALGPAHTWRQSAFLRGRNASRRVAGLLYAGSSTIPGIGLPMCLISAELVLKRLRGDASSAPLTEPEPCPAAEAS